MASNAPTRESTAESTNEHEIVAKLAEAKPVRARARRTKTSTAKKSPRSTTATNRKTGEEVSSAETKLETTSNEKKLCATAKPTSQKANGRAAKRSKKSNFSANEPVGLAKTAIALASDELLALDSIKKLLEVGHQRGTVNRHDLRLAFKDDHLGKQDFEGVLALLREEDIPLAPPAENTEADNTDNRSEDPDAKATRRYAADEGGSFDPVRVYLREMGQVTLLTREGEVEIAQRIEVAVDAQLAALTSNAYCLRRLVEVGEFVRVGKLELKKVVDGLEDEDGPPIEETETKFLTAVTRLEKIESSLIERRKALTLDAMSRDD